MTAAHTPGPWNVGRCTWNEDANVCYELTGVKQGNASDARLIAAAPELLAALQEMVDVTEDECHLDHHGYCQAHYLDDTNNGGCRVANAKAAIIKATGQAT